MTSPDTETSYSSGIVVEDRDGVFYFACDANLSSLLIPPRCSSIAESYFPGAYSVSAARATLIGHDQNISPDDIEKLSSYTLTYNGTSTGFMVQTTEGSIYFIPNPQDAFRIGEQYIEQAREAIKNADPKSSTALTACYVTVNVCPADRDACIESEKCLPESAVTCVNLISYIYSL